MARIPQMGTELCEKVVVPQTGKAVEGFWPSAVHVCALTETLRPKTRTNARIKYSLVYIVRETVSNVGNKADYWLLETVPFAG